MNRHGKFKWMIVAIEVLAIAAFITLVVFPLERQTSYRCWYCSARDLRTQYLFIQAAPKVTEDELSKYFRKEVDSHHRHTWVRLSYYEHRLLGKRVGSSARTLQHPRWLLKDDVIVAILRTLPNPSTRKAFMKELWNDGAYQSNDLIQKIETAYDENPKRKDWPVILKKSDR